MPRGKDKPTCTVPGCSREHRAHGYCNMHYQRWKKTGSVGAVDAARRTPANLDDGRSMDEHVMELFLSGIRKLENGCWVCDTAYPMSEGYTEVKIGRGSMGIFRQCTHVLSYQHFRGPIPDGELVCHTCDFRPCCNPDHLFSGTYLDNQGDMAAKDRVAFGERHYNAKLTDADVIAIYKMGRAGIKQKEIALQFGVSRSRIGSILNGTAWTRLYARRAA